MIATEKDRSGLAIFDDVREVRNERAASTALHLVIAVLGYSFILLVVVTVVILVWLVAPFLPWLAGPVLFTVLAPFG
jgi:hypothetical protein